MLAILRYMPAFVLHNVCAYPAGTSKNKAVKICRRWKGGKMYGHDIRYIIGEASQGMVLLDST